jgi:hypothetical protein
LNNKAPSPSSAGGELLVFVSSTGDLAAARQEVRRAIDHVNKRLEEDGFRQRMRPIMWEDLPPGEAPEGDFQAFIDTLLGQFERDRFAIYLGFAKRRIGSPTPRFPSGTVEEFENSLAARRKSGWPREVLFYFIEDPALEPALLGWKGELGRRGYLYQEVTAEAFGSRVEQALYDISSTWNRLGVRVRRVARAYLRPTAFLVAATAALFAAYTLWASGRIYSPLSQGKLAEACQTLQSDGRFLWVDPFAIKSRIDRSLTAAVAPGANSEALLRNLDSLAIWQSCRTGRTGIDSATTSLSKAVRNEVADSQDDVALLLKARGVALFDRSPDNWRKLPRMAAARRLFDLHVAGADDPFERLDRYLSAAERQAVKEFAGERQSPTPAISRALAAASGDETRIIDALLKLDDRATSRFVYSGIKRLSPDGRMRVIEAVWPTANGASSQVEEWLAASIASAIATLEPADPKLLGDVIVRLQLRSTPITLQAIAEAPDGIPQAEFKPEELEAVLGDGKNFKWLRAIALLASDASEQRPLTGCLTVRYATEIAGSDGFDKLSKAMLDHLEKAGFARLMTEDGLDVALIRLFGKARRSCTDQSGQELFADLLQKYADGSISYGFAQKAALIAAFAGAPGTRDRNLAIVSRALDESASSPGAFAPDPEPVENAWFNSLDREPNLDQPDFIALLERIVDRRASKGSVKDGLPLGSMLLNLPNARLLDLLRYPAPTLLDPPWSENWARRDVLISSLSDYNMSVWGMSGRPIPYVTNAILAGLPADESGTERRKLLEIQAWTLFGGDAATVLGDRARAGDRDALRLLANLWPASLMKESEFVTALDDAALAEVVSGMNDRANSSCQTFPACSIQVSSNLRDLLWARSETFQENEELRIQLLHAIASALDRNPNDFHAQRVRQSVANWIEKQSLAGGDLAWLTAQSFFFAEEPWRLPEIWKFDARNGTIEAVASTLAAADEISWLFMTQNLVGLAEQGVDSSLWPIASAQPRAIVSRRGNDTQANHGLPLGDELVTNPFIAAYSSGDAKPGDVVGQLLAMIARADLRSDETVSGTAEGPQFGGFLRWALARMAERAGGTCLPSLPDPLTGLDSSHPAIRAGQASLAIAASENLIEPNCGTAG